MTGNGGPVEPLRGEDSVGDREREEPSTPIHETSAVADRWKTEETTGGGEEMETDAEVGSTADERNTSMHPKERQQVTDDDGWVKPLRGKRGTKDGAERNQDRQYGPSTIGINGESCVGKQRRFVDTGGLRRATKDTDTEVGVMACSTVRKHGEQGESGKRVMGSSKDQSMSAHSEDNINIRGEPTGGKCGTGRVGMPRCAAQKKAESGV